MAKADVAPKKTSFENAGEDNRALRIIKRQESLEGAQFNFRARWQDCATFIANRKGNILAQHSEGEETQQDIYDTTATQAAMVAASGTLANLTPPGELWGRFKAKKKAGQPRNDAEDAWFKKSTEQFFDILYGSNFYEAWHETLYSLWCFSTADLIEQGDDDTVLNFAECPVGTFYIAENSKGRVDTVYRKFELTARQAAQEYGKDSLGADCQAACDDPKKQDSKFWFVEEITPRANWRDVPYAEGELRRFSCIYVDVKGKVVVKETGYYENPHNVCRLMCSNNEIYGRGPGIDLMPEIKLVNRMEQDLLLGLELAVRPPWLVPADSPYRPDNRPDGVNYWSAKSPMEEPKQMQSVARLDLGEQKTEQKRTRIRDGFFVPMFQILTQMEEMKRQKTAFEVAQMLQEKLILFAPFFGRITREILTPALITGFNLCARAGVFDPPPLVNGQESLEFEIEYVSKIALALKAAKQQSLARMISLIDVVSKFYPGAVEVINWERALKASMDDDALPVDWQNSDEEIAALRQQRMQMAMTEPVANAMKKTASAAKDLGPEAQQMATDQIAGRQ
jgi:hypothetical protein